MKVLRALYYCVYTATWNHASMVQAQLGMINSGMTKACQHCAEPSRAVLAQLVLTKQAGMKLA